MITKVYAVFDEKAGAFLQPFYCNNDAQAVRLIVDVMLDPKHSFFRYATDYTLHRLGSFDNVTGLLESSVSCLTLLVNLRSDIMKDETLSLFHQEISKP